MILLDLVTNIKVGMIKNAMGLSDIGFMTYLNYLNITISMLYSFDLISKNEYDYLLKYISNVDLDILCKRGVYNEKRVKLFTTTKK